MYSKDILDLFDIHMFTNDSDQSGIRRGTFTDIRIPRHIVKEDPFPVMIRYDTLGTDHVFSQLGQHTAQFFLVVAVDRPLYDRGEERHDTYRVENFICVMFTMVMVVMFVFITSQTDTVAFGKTFVCGCFFSCVIMVVMMLVLVFMLMLMMVFMFVIMFMFVVVMMLVFFFFFVIIFQAFRETVGGSGHCLKDYCAG